MADGSPPAAAECTSLDPWPPFATTARAARDVIVGTVVEDRDPSSSGYLKRFGLRVDEVLRGRTETGEVVEIAYLSTGLPLKVCRDTYLSPLLGDVIALALDAPTPDGRHINSAAWLVGAPDDMQRGLGRITRSELHRLMALPQTDADAPMPEAAAVDGVLPRILMLGVAAGFGAVLWLVRRRRPT